MGYGIKILLAPPPPHYAKTPEKKILTIDCGLSLILGTELYVIPYFVLHVPAAAYGFTLACRFSPISELVFPNTGVPSAHFVVI